MPTSEGQRLLMVAAKGKGRRAAIARAIGRSKPTVSALVDGESDPTLDTALALKAHLGIPLESWSQKPNGKAKRTRKTT